MQKWEYCEIEVIIGGPISGVKGRGHYFRSNGKHKGFEGDYGTLLAELGEAGYEVVVSSARIETGLTNKHKINYLLKRPIES